MLLSGPPPDGHQRQCRSKSSHTGERCRKWALTGRNFCQSHGGRAKRGKRNLGHVYTASLGPRLKDKVNRLLNQSHEEQVQLYEELALTRVAAQEAVNVVNAVMELPNVEASTMQLALGVMTEALGCVKDFALAVSKIEKDSEDKVSIRVIDLFIVQVMSAIRKVCGDDVALVDKINREIDETVRLPADTSADAGGLVDGTYITPDKMVQEMDEQMLGINDTNNSGLDEVQTS